VKRALLAAAAVVFWVAVGHGHSWVFAAFMLAVIRGTLAIAWHDARTRVMLVFVLVALLAACQATPTTTDPEPDPDPVTVSYRTYYGTGGGSQLLMFVDILASEPTTVTIYAAGTIGGVSLLPPE